MRGWIKTSIRLCSGTDCTAAQSDARLCCNNPGEFVIFSCFLFVVMN